MNSPSKSELLNKLENSFNEAIAYYKEDGANSMVTVGDWGPKETLAHMIYFCERNAQAMKSVITGNGPLPILEPPYTNVNDLNASKVNEYANKSLQELVIIATESHYKMLEAAQAMPALDTPVILRPNGEMQTAQIRIDGTANHWVNHVNSLKESS